MARHHARALDAVQHGALWLLEFALPALLLVVMTGVTFLDVLLRYLFRSPITGAAELATTCFVWLVFLGSAAAARRQMHIGIEFLVDLFPTVLRRVVHVLVHLAMIATLATIGVFALRYGLASGHRSTPLLNISYTYIYLAIPVGFGLMAMHYALSMFQPPPVLEIGEQPRTSLDETADPLPHAAP